MPVVPSRTIGFSKVEPDLYIYVSSSNKNPSNEDFYIYLDFLKRHLKAGVIARSIVYERYEGISATQRKLLRDTTEAYTPVVAVITASTIARGIVTALSWFNKDFKAFSPDDRLSAFKHIGLQPPRTDEAWRTIQNLVFELDGPPLRAK